MARSEEERRGYGLGERNPATLPNGSHGHESHDENRRATLRWRQVVGWAKKPGGKY